MAIFNGGAGQNNNFVGDATADTFNFAVADFNGSDTIVGGSGGAVDILNLTTSGAVLSTAFANTSGIEQISLSSGGNSVVLTNALVGSANGTLLSVIGGAGNDTINGSAVTTATNRLFVTAGAGNDSITGGAGADTVRFNAADLTSLDTVAGGSGTSLDTLQFLTAGAISSASLANVSGFEYIRLADGANSITLTNALAGSANGAILTVLGGSGSDTINGSAVTAANRLDITAGAGADSITAGAGADTVRFSAADLTSADVVAGGAGSDTLLITAGGTITAANLSGVSGFEQINIFAGGVNISLNDQVLTANAANLLVTGGAGNDTVNGAGITNAAKALTILAGAGNDSLVGGAGFDTFRFNTADLTASDTVIGGTGSSVDILQILNSGTISAAALANVSGIDRVTLSTSGASISVSNAMVGSANNSLLSIVSGDGSDTINGSAVTTAGNRLYITTNGGNDSLTGGAGADTFRFNNVTDLTSADFVSGGSGASVDQLLFGAAGTITSAMLANVSGIEQFALSAGANSVTLTNALVGSANGGLLYVYGNTGSDLVDATAVTTAANRVTMNAFAGNDTLLGGAGADVFRVNAADFNASDRFIGGSGASADQLLFQTAGTIASGSFAQVSGVEYITLANGANSLTLTDALAASANGALLYVLGGSGGDTINGAAVTAANKLDILAGAGVDSITAGAGADTVRFAAADLTSADVAVGGGGTDTLLITTAGTVTAANLAGVSGFEQVNIFGGGVNLGLTNAVLTANGPTLTVIGGAGNDSVSAAGVTDATKAIVFRAGAGNDSFAGGAETDTININAADLTNSDTFSGGSGAAVDVLAFQTAGTINQLAGVTGFERITLAAGANSILLTNALVSSANAQTLQVIGGIGNDTINGGSISDASYKLDITAGSGNDTLIGGVSADTFRIAISELSNLDSISGGIGLAVDTLALSTVGTLDLTALTSVSAIERIQLANGTNFLTVSDAFVDSATGDTVTVTGGTGADTINLVNVGSGAPRTVVVNSGDGADLVSIDEYTSTFTGDLGLGNDTLSAYAGAGPASFAGGGGTDTVQYDFWSYSEETMGAGITGFEIARLVDSDPFGVYTNTFYANNTAGLTVNVGPGDDNYVIFLGAGGQIANGGDTSETIYGGSGVDTINGGGGNDLIDYSATDASINGGAGTGDGIRSQVGGTFNLSNVADQATSGAVVATNFESVYFAGSVGGVATGSSGANVLSGGDGSDTLDGFGGLDTVVGGIGADTISYRGTEASISGDYVGYGYGSNDTLVLRAATTIDLSNLADQSIADATTIVQGFTHVSAAPLNVGVTITGDDYNNSITGGSAGDQISSGSGSDTVDGGAGADTQDLGDSDDFGVYDAADNLLDGGAGTDTLLLRTNGVTVNLALADQVLGDAGLQTGFEIVDASTTTVGVNLTGRDDVSSTLLGGSGADTLQAGSAGTLLDGGTGADRVLGGIGNDTVSVESGDIAAGESIDGGDGYDYLRPIGSVNFTGATFSNIEALEIELGASVTLTGAQATSLTQISADYFGTERLTVNVASGTTADFTGVGFYGIYDNDIFVINGAAGGETISNVGARATINGGAGADSIFTAVYDGTVLNGEAGNDTIGYDYSPTENAATIDGGADIDTLNAFYTYSEVSIDLSQTTDQTIGDNTVVRNFENVDFSANAYGVNVLGSSGANAITGSNAADTIVGGLGQDTLNGLAGNDLITYDGSDQAINGGDDTDTLIVVGTALGANSIDLGNLDQTTGDVALVSNFEHVDASGATTGVRITGSDTVVSELIGGSGADSITAGEGGANITGGLGADTLVANATGTNFIVSAGEFVAGESIVGGAGLDRLFVYGSTDFTVGTLTGSVDRIELASAGMSVTVSGAQAGQLGDFYNQDTGNETVETVTVNVASGTSADFSSVVLYNFGPEDIFRVNGAAGNETIDAFDADNLVIDAGGGNDSVAYGLFEDNLNVTIDGGAGTGDTLFASDFYTGGYNAFGYTEINLASATDQVTTDSIVTRNFENIDWSAAGYEVYVTGSSAANSIIGGTVSDGLDGGGGADTIDGYGSFDTLTGGSGADTFRFAAAESTIDDITDFASVDDTLSFASSIFSVSGGVVDTQATDTTGAANINGVDLIRYTGGQLDYNYEVDTYLSTNGTGTGGAAFILATNTSGYTQLFYTSDNTGGGTTYEIAQFTNGLAIGQIQLNDFLIA